MGILRNVELFDAGSSDTHKGQDYTDEDLEDIIKNFKRFSGDGPGPRVNPPCVIGHEENQEWLRNTGLPAAGWPVNLRKVGRKLVGDLTDLPEDVADAISKGAYRYVSAEIYDTPPAGVPGKGKMLRRVAFLGGELPHLKTLKRLPHPEMFSEYDKEANRVNIRLVQFRKSSDGTYLAFSEVAMDRDGMIQALTAKGMDKSTLDGMDDNQLAAVMKISQSGEPGTQMAGMDKGGALNAFRESCKRFMDAYKGMFGEDMPVDMQDEDAVSEPPVPAADAEPEDEGVDESELDDDAKPADEGEEPVETAEEPVEEETDDDQEFGEGNNVDSSVATEEPDKNKKKTVSSPQYFSEGELEKMITRIVNKAVGNATGSLVKKFSEQESDFVDSFLMKMDTEGRIAPSELDGSGGRLTLRDKLLAMDNATVIGKFSDSRGRKDVPMTLRQAEMDRIRGLPQLYREKVKVTSGTSEIKVFSESDLELDRVRKFCESEDGRAKLRVTQTDPKEFLKIYEVADKQARAEFVAAYGI